MKLPLVFSFLIGIASCSTCYSPTIFKTQNQLLDKITADTQLICDKQCTDDEKCIAIVVEHKTNHVICGFLGAEIDWTMCAKAAEVYKKVECGPEFQAGGYMLADVDPATALQRLIYTGPSRSQGCEVQLLLINKTTLVRRANPADSPSATVNTEALDQVVDAWGYCTV